MGPECYVYLSDVASEVGLASSRWFTRSWTLLELIVPKDVRPYSITWDLVHTKANLSDLISSIINIDKHILTGKDLESFSVVRKISWASRRKRCRIENIAYCLLGIFNVNLPLI